MQKRGSVGEMNFGDQTILVLGSQVLISQLNLKVYSFVCL